MADDNISKPMVITRKDSLMQKVIDDTALNYLNMTVDPNDNVYDDLKI